MKYNDDLIEELVLPHIINKVDKLIAHYGNMFLFIDPNTTSKTASDIYMEIYNDLKELREEFEDGV